MSGSVPRAARKPYYLGPVPNKGQSLVTGRTRTRANISEQRLELSETSAPGPVFDPIAKTRLDRVLEDVPRSLGEVILALQNVRLEPLFEDVSAPVMTR